MNKKAYIIPAVTTIQLAIADGILQAVSGTGLSNDPAKQENGMDTKDSGAWDIWD